MPLLIHLAEIGVGVLVERIVLELLVERLDRVVVVALRPIGAAQIVVGVFVVRINFNLFLKINNGRLVLPLGQIEQSQVVPGKFVFWIDFRGAFQQGFGDGKVAGVCGRTGAVDQFVSFHVGWRNRRSGGRAFHRKLLLQVRPNGAAEGFIVGGASHGKIVLVQYKHAAGSENVALKLVGRTVLGVIALQGKLQGRMGGVLGGQFQLDLVRVLAFGTELQRIGVRIGFRIRIGIGQAELHQRQNDLRLLLRPVQEVGARHVVSKGERLFGRGRIADFQVGKVSAQPGVDVFGNPLPVRFRHAPENGAQHEFFVAVELIADVGFELADVVNLAVDFRLLGIGHGRVGGSFFQMRRDRGFQNGGWNHQRLLVAQAVGQQAERSHFAGRVHPHFLLAILGVNHGQHGDDVIELRRRRHVRIKLAARIDENRVGMQAFGIQQ